VLKRVQRSKPSISKYKQLTVKEVHRFIEQGFLLVRNVFSRELVERIIPTVWAELNSESSDRSTAASPMVMLKKVFEHPPFPQILTERYLGAVDDLCGEGRWEATLGVGHWPILLPGFAQAPWCPPKGGWHVDIKLDQPRIDFPDFGLINIEFFSDIEPGGGGTAIRIGSHWHVARILEKVQRAGRMNRHELHLRTVSDTNHLPVIEVTGQAGDVLMMHPFTMHATSPNTSNRARIAAVKLIRLHEPLNLTRQSSRDYSPVERAIVEALGENR